jgi:hypothetical protein
MGRSRRTGCGPRRLRPRGGRVPADAGAGVRDQRQRAAGLRRRGDAGARPPRARPHGLPRVRQGEGRDQPLHGRRGDGHGLGAARAQIAVRLPPAMAEDEHGRELPLGQRPAPAAGRERAARAAGADRGGRLAPLGLRLVGPRAHALPRRRVRDRGRRRAAHGRPGVHPDRRRGGPQVDRGRLPDSPLRADGGAGGAVARPPRGPRLHPGHLRRAGARLAGRSPRRTAGAPPRARRRRTTGLQPHAGPVPPRCPAGAGAAGLDRRRRQVPGRAVGQRPAHPLRRQRAGFRGGRAPARDRARRGGVPDRLALRAGAPRGAGAAAVPQPD